MNKALNKIKLITGVALSVQAAVCALLSLLLFNKRSATSKAFLTVSLIGGIIGPYLVYKHYTDDKCEDYDEVFDINNILFPEDNSKKDIPEDDTATEEEFEDNI